MTIKRMGQYSIAALVLMGIFWGVVVLIQHLTSPKYALATATRHDIAISVRTHGTIEPIDPAEIVAQIDGIVADLYQREGNEVTEGSPLLRLESQILTADLAEAREALAQARAAESQITAATSQQKTAGAEDSSAGLDSEFGRQIKELAAKVAALEQEEQKGSVAIPKSGLLYSLTVNKGDFVTGGKLLAQIYTPGRVKLRVDIAESDVAGIERGQKVLIESYGMPGRQWTAILDQPPQELVAQDNRFVGQAFCLVDGEPRELTPNLKVTAEIITANKPAALAVPKSAVFFFSGQPSVFLLEAGQPSLRPVTTGIATADEIEILQGIEEGNSVITNPADLMKP